MDKLIEVLKTIGYVISIVLPIIDAKRGIEKGLKSRVKKEVKNG